MEHIYTWLRTGNSWMMGEGDWFANLCFLVPAFPLSVEDDIWSLRYNIADFKRTIIETGNLKLPLIKFNKP